MEWTCLHPKIYFDTSSWIRLFERGSNTIDLERVAAYDILNMCMSSKKCFSIISSKFQYEQLAKLEREALTLHKRRTCRRARLVCAAYCPHSIKMPTDYEDTTKKLLELTMMDDKEDAQHISIAWMNGISRFITTDKELCTDGQLPKGRTGKRTRIQDALIGMTLPPGRNHTYMMLLNPVDMVLPEI